MDLEAFEQLVRDRRAVRHFKPDPLPEGLLERLLDAAHWAPSGYNLQPTHFAVATDPALKERLLPCCMYQKQICEAPAVVVFLGDRDVVKYNFEKMVQAEKDAGSINERYEQMLRKMVPLAFDKGPLHTHWLWKKFLLPVVRRVKPIPRLPAVEEEYWLTKQVMLSSMVFMLAASAAGLSTVPMEGFDERKVKKILNIPRRFVAPLLTPVGYAADGQLKKTRLPIQDLVHYNEWTT
ncbi:nitroreductase family protein [bacterium]|nr:nitroreductase family protein [bacterium]